MENSGGIKWSQCLDWYKKVLKSWFDFFLRRGLRFFQGLWLFQSLEYFSWFWKSPWLGELKFKFVLCSCTLFHSECPHKTHFNTTCRAMQYVACHSLKTVLKINLTPLKKFGSKNSKWPWCQLLIGRVQKINEKIRFQLYS